MAPNKLKPIGTTIRFQFLLADGATALLGEGVVVQVRPPEPGNAAAPVGMLIKFTKLSQESKDLVDRITHMKSGVVATVEADPVTREAPVAGPEDDPDDPTYEMDLQEYLKQQDGATEASEAEEAPAVEAADFGGGSQQVSASEAVEQLQAELGDEVSHGPRKLGQTEGGLQILAFDNITDEEAGALEFDLGADEADIDEMFEGLFGSSEAGDDGMFGDMFGGGADEAAEEEPADEDEEDFDAPQESGSVDREPIFSLDELDLDDEPPADDPADEPEPDVQPEQEAFPDLDIDLNLEPPEPDDGSESEELVEESEELIEESEELIEESEELVEESEELVEESEELVEESEELVEESEELVEESEELLEAPDADLVEESEEIAAEPVEESEPLLALDEASESDLIEQSEDVDPEPDDLIEESEPIIAPPEDDEDSELGLQESSGVGDMDSVSVDEAFDDSDSDPLPDNLNELSDSLDAESEVESLDLMSEDVELIDGSEAEDLLEFESEAGDEEDDDAMPPTTSGDMLESLGALVQDVDLPDEPSEQEFDSGPSELDNLLGNLESDPREERSMDLHLANDPFADDEEEAPAAEPSFGVDEEEDEDSLDFLLAAANADIQSRHVDESEASDESTDILDDLLGAEASLPPPPADAPVFPTQQEPPAKKKGGFLSKLFGKD